MSKGEGKGLGTAAPMPNMKPGKVLQSSGNAKPVPVPAKHPFSNYMTNAGRRHPSYTGKK